MAIVNGNDLMLFIGATKQPLAHSTSAKISLGKKLQDISTKMSGEWEDSSNGRKNWSVSTDGLVEFTTTGATGTTVTIESLYDQFISNDDDLYIDLVFGLLLSGTSNTTKTYYTGKGRIESLDLNAGKDEKASYSVSIKGCGALVQVKK